MLINSLLAHATDTWWEVFISQLERLNTRKAIIVSPVVPCGATRTDDITQRLMSSHTVEDLTSCVLDFQGNMARVIYRKKTTLVEPDVEETHAAALDYIWTNSRLQAVTAPDGTTLKWRQLGFASENLSHEFTEVGVLGLDCLVSSAFWHKMSTVNIPRKRKIWCKQIQTSSQRWYRSKIVGPHSGGVLSHVHRKRSLSFYRSTGVYWLLDACLPYRCDLVMS